MAANYKKVFVILSGVMLLTGCKPAPSSSSSSQSESGSESQSQNQSESIPIYEVEDKWAISSPQKNLNINVFTTKDGMIMYNVKRDGVAVVRDSRLGLQTVEVDLQYLLTFISKKDITADISYPSISGKKQNYTTSYNESVLTFKEFDYYLDIYMRAYNDGFAFRYGIRPVKESSAKTLRWEDEVSEFNLPYQSKTYAMAYKPSGNKDGYYWYSYEDNFNYRRSDRLGNASFSMPFMYEAYKGTYTLLTESELIGSKYHGSFLRINENGVLQTVYPDAHGKNPDLSIEVEGFKTPWRLGIVGSLGDIIESNLVEDVYDEVEYWKPHNYETLTAEKQKTYDYEWVEPSVTAWNWLYYTGNTPQNDYALQRRYIDLAAEMGWGWSIVDGGWSGGRSNQEIRDLTAYAKSKGIKIAAWAHSFNDFTSKEQMQTKLTLWKSLGIDGVKVDFWDGQEANVVPAGQMEDKQTLQRYEDFYQVTAGLEMIVNAHGANKPTGERRLYPHILNREAVRGNEFKAVSTQQTVFNTFIRATIGPTDFTPTVRPFRTGVTTAHQMALNIMYESGTPSMADHESRYSEADYVDFFKALPAVWDDIRFLDGEIETHAIIARRKGNDWWIGGINVDNALNSRLDLSFLSNGQYIANIYEDFDTTTGPDSRIAMRHVNVTNQTMLDVAMVAKGGFAIHLVKK